LVRLASNFIVGDEVIPLDAEKHMETPLMEGTDPACIFLGIVVVPASDPPWRRKKM